MGLSLENKDCPTQADGCTGKIQLFRERLSEKVHATILKGIVGGFEFTITYCSSKTFERMTREAMNVCLRVLKESNKSRFDSYSVRNRVY